MEDQTFIIYSESSLTLKGEIRDGCLHLTSEVWGGGYDGEQYIDFSKDNTDKLFSLLSLNEFICMCQKVHLLGLDKYLDEKGIERSTFTWLDDDD